MWSKSTYGIASCPRPTSSLSNHNFSQVTHAARIPTCTHPHTQTLVASYTCTTGFRAVLRGHVGCAKPRCEAGSIQGRMRQGLISSQEETSVYKRRRHASGYRSVSSRKPDIQGKHSSFKQPAVFTLCSKLISQLTPDNININSHHQPSKPSHPTHQNVFPTA
jgi:hypothetical protein